MPCLTTQVLNIQFSVVNKTSRARLPCDAPGRASSSFRSFACSSLSPRLGFAHQSMVAFYADRNTLCVAFIALQRRLCVAQRPTEARRRGDASAQPARKASWCPTGVRVGRSSTYALHRRGLNQLRRFGARWRSY